MPTRSTCWKRAASWKAARHAELVAQKGLYYAMWRQQIGEREAPPAAPARVEDETDDPGAALDAGDVGDAADAVRPL